MRVLHSFVGFTFVDSKLGRKLVLEGVVGLARWSALAFALLLVAGSARAGVIVFDGELAIRVGTLVLLGSGIAGLVAFGRSRARK